MGTFGHIVKRDVQLAFRQGSAAMMVVSFFVIVVSLFPFGVGPELNVLARISSGVIWVCAMLATMLSLDRLFQADYEDGNLEILLMSPLPLEFVVLAKCFAHWLTTGLPLMLAAPVLAVLLNMPFEGFGSLVMAMLLGTPVLSLIGAIGAALTVSLRRGGVLMSLLVLPLYVPVLIFGVNAVDGAIMGFETQPPLLVLSGVFLATLVLCPWAAAAALRLSLE